MNIFTEIAAFLKNLPVSPTEVVDILLVSLVAYRLLVVIRGTRAAKMAVGIAFLILGYFIAERLELPLSRRILANFAPVMAFALIVLYQDEIRKILSDIGSTRLFRLFMPKEKVLDYEEIALAAVTLSSKRIGALIIVERAVGLRNYMENGIMLNSNLSYDLLVTVFHPETPLHDGAVIVQKDRIAAASCFLPLTLEPHLSKEYGTRHRAAIGITEETDAIAVVVSEETGRISIAVEGKLKRMDDSDALAAFLRQNVAQRAKRFRPFSSPERENPEQG
ncbi:MAG: diadenylate cyclase CdaA [Acidobacteria bacterium]|nr:diadenylate cyclase CdaA [Acidobacteriota bacterium]